MVQTWNEAESLSAINDFFGDSSSEEYDSEYDHFFNHSSNQEWNQEESAAAIANFFNYDSESEDEVFVAKPQPAAKPSTKVSGEDFQLKDHYSYTKGDFLKYKIGQSLQSTAASDAEFESVKPVKPVVPGLASIAFQVAAVFSVLLAVQSALLFVLDKQVTLSMAKLVVFAVLSAGVVVARANTMMLTDFRNKKALSSGVSAQKVKSL